MLTDKQCKKASCPEGQARIRMTDSGGLYLEVAGAGSKRWFWNRAPAITQRLHAVHVTSLQWHALRSTPRIQPMSLSRALRQSVSRLLIGVEIGRASCRERVYSSV